MNKRTNQQIVAERSFAAGASIRDAEVAELRQQVTLLRDACHELMNLPNKYPGHREMASISIIAKVLAATEPEKIDDAT